MKEILNQPLHLDLAYRVNQEVKVLDLSEAYENNDLTVKFSLTPNKKATRLVVTVNPKVTIELNRQRLSVMDRKP